MKNCIVIFLVLVFCSKIEAQLTQPNCILNEANWKNCHCNELRYHDTVEVKLIDLNNKHGDSDKNLLVRIELETEFNNAGDLIFASFSYSNVRSQYFLYCLEGSNYLIGKRWKKSEKVICERTDKLENPEKKFLKLWNEMMSGIISYCNG